MFFRRNKQTKPAETEAKQPSSSDGSAASGLPETVSDPKPANENAAVPMTEPPLAPDVLRRKTDQAALGFKTTGDLEPLLAPVGSGVAMDTLRYGCAVSAPGHNVCVIASSAGMHGAVLQTLKEHRPATAQDLRDWVYVTNFEDPARPTALSFAPGGAAKFSKALVDALDALRDSIPSAFESEDYLVRARAINERYRSATDVAIAALREKAHAQNIAVLRTPSGYAMAPMLEGKVVRSEVFSQLPPNLRTEVESKLAELQTEMAEILAAAPNEDHERRTQLATLNSETAGAVIGQALQDLREAVSDELPVADYLVSLERDLTSNAQKFLDEGGAAESTLASLRNSAQIAHLQPYLPNLIIDAASRKAEHPIVDAGTLSAMELAGSISSSAVQPGLLHAAAGGYLIVNAADVLDNAKGRSVLRQALQSGRIAPALASASATTVGPIPVAVKCILFATPEQASQLSAQCPELMQLFGVTAQIPDSVERTPDTEKEFAKMLAGLADRHSLLPLDASAVTSLAEYAAEVLHRPDQLCVNTDLAAGILHQVDHAARTNNAGTMTQEHVQMVLKWRLEQSNMTLQEGLSPQARFDLHSAAKGKQVGRVTTILDGSAPADKQKGLSEQPAQFLLASATATIQRPGSSSGGETMSLHLADEQSGGQRGASISAYLAQQFSQVPAKPLAIHLATDAIAATSSSSSPSAHKGASLAEVCALLSALSGLPARQDIVVCGLTNSTGEVRATCNVNKSVAHIFDINKSAQTGFAGAVIATSDEQDLMLRHDIIDAVEAGEFKIWSVKTVAQCIALLTDTAAGDASGDVDSDDGFPSQSVFDRVQKTLAANNQSRPDDKARSSRSGDLT